MKPSHHFRNHRDFLLEIGEGTAENTVARQVEYLLLVVL
jgi:hypothetical protein